MPNIMEVSPEDKDKLKRAIIAGSVLASIYFFDRVTADEYYKKDKDGNFILKRKSTIEEIFE